MLPPYISSIFFYVTSAPYSLHGHGQESGRADGPTEHRGPCRGGAVIPCASVLRRDGAKVPGYGANVKVSGCTTDNNGYLYIYHMLCIHMLCIICHIYIIVVFNIYTKTDG